MHTLGDLPGARARAAKAYRIVKDEFNWDRIAEQTIEVYERIVRERARSNW